MLAHAREDRIRLTQTTRHRRPGPERAARLVCLVALAAVAALAVSATASAASAEKKKGVCWRQLMNDWYDNGRVDRSYEIACYRAAIKHLPRDVRNYSDAYDVMSRALSSALRKKNANDETVVPPPGGPGDGGSGNGGNSGGPSGGGNGGTTSPDASGSGGQPTPTTGFLNEATDSLGSDRADSVPVPLLVLAGLALLLVAAGAAGLIARRLQGRRPRP